MASFPQSTLPTTPTEGQHPASLTNTSGMLTTAASTQTTPADFMEEDFSFEKGGVKFRLRLSAHFSLSRPFQELLLTIDTPSSIFTSSGGQQTALYFRSLWDPVTKSLTNELYKIKVNENLLFQVAPRPRTFYYRTWISKRSSARMLDHGRPLRSRWCLRLSALKPYGSRSSPECELCLGGGSGSS
jgi:hypothetical protein